MVFGVGCGDNVTEAKQTLEEVLKADDRVLDDPPWKIAVAGLADGKVSIVVRPWVKTPDYWDVLYDVAESAKLKFGTRGINITFSQ